MDLKGISLAINQIAENRGIKAEAVIEAIESALASAYKKEYRDKSEVVRAKFDPKSGKLKFWQIKTVVTPDEVRMPDEEPVENEEDDERKIKYSENRHIFLKEAKKEKTDVKSGDEIKFLLETHEEFGRIAAQTAKQVVLQSVREAERASIQNEFADKEGEIISGVIQRYEQGHVYVDLGRALGVMFKNESIPGEHYQRGQRMRFYILAIQEEERGRSGIILSRSHPDFIRAMFELEVPEITEGMVEIKKIAREPGSRTKIAVTSNDESVDPIGSIVGQRGSRIMAVINELSNEKIDVVEWNDDMEKYIASALSPAKVKMVEIKPRREAIVLVANDQLSLAIGKGGQNVRLAAKLTGWKIDVRSQSDPEVKLEGGISEAKEEEIPEEESQEEKSEE